MKDAAWQLAKKNGWPTRGQFKGASFVLMGFVDGRPYYYITDNVNAAITTAADQVRQTPPYNLSGAGLTVGVWDWHALVSHQEFGGRVQIMDTPLTITNHSSHIIGTVCATGVNASAKGMAPSIHVDNYDMVNDAAEIASRAAAFPGETNKIFLSNHSYGVVAGWKNGSYSGNAGPHWFGRWPEREDRSFGQYGLTAATYDGICYAAAYFLPFKSAGNVRDDVAPENGTTFYYVDWSIPAWIGKAYNDTTDPYDTGWDNGGFDTVGPLGSAKNILTVGAIDDAVSGGSRFPSNGTMTTFSGWGPTDDGRVKPDIVANGVAVLSCQSTGTNQYAEGTGTSEATPNAMGSAALLVEHYNSLFPGKAMRSSTLKGLIIHTADDLGNVGPDYSFGWGLMNTKAAADQITNHHDQLSARRITEGTLELSNTSDLFAFSWDGVHPIRATLCWTDPPADVIEGLDNPSPRLKNDLDLRVFGPGGSPTYYPYILDPANPSTPATVGDNSLDNVEQLLVASPGAEGTYTVEVTFKGDLTDDQQAYSLILSGQSNELPTSTPTPTETCTSTATQTPTPTPTKTPSPTVTLTDTPSWTPTATFTQTATSTETPSLTNTPSATPSSSYTPTGTYTPSTTPTYTVTPTATNTLSHTPTAVDPSGDADGDGIVNSVEDNGPNGGDANFDGIVDSLQSCVASFPNETDGRYLAVVAPASTALEGVGALGYPSMEAPSAFFFPFHWISFRITGVEMGTAITVDLILPDEPFVDSYWNYGMTSDNLFDHWYEFLFSEATGALIRPAAIELHFTDGGLGDGDLTPNGEVMHLGGPAVEIPSSNSNWWLY